MNLNMTASCVGFITPLCWAVPASNNALRAIISDPCTIASPCLFIQTSSYREVTRGYQSASVRDQW